MVIKLMVSYAAGARFMRSHFDVARRQAIAL